MQNQLQAEAHHLRNKLSEAEHALQQLTQQRSADMQAQQYAAELKSRLDQSQQLLSELQAEVQRKQQQLHQCEVQKDALKERITTLQVSYLETFSWPGQSTCRAATSTVQTSFCSAAIVRHTVQLEQLH